MNRGPKLYLVCYDISDERRLRRVYQVIRGYGERLQYSVYRCQLNDLRLAELCDKLCDEIDHSADQVLIVPLGSVDSRAAWKMDTLGRPLPVVERVVRVIG